MDGASSVSGLLRKARAAAVKLGLADQLQWISWELEGYPDEGDADLPPYRTIRGEMKVVNPYHGLLPLNFADPEVAETIRSSPCRQSIAELEALLATGENLRVQLSQWQINQLLNSMPIKMEPVLLIDRTALIRVLDAVRNLILNWSLEMEKAGVLGEALTFNSQEKEKAQPVGQQFFIQNLGVLGNISGHATVSNTQDAALTLDFNQARNVVAQLNGLMAALPSEIRSSLAPVLNELNDRLQESSPTPGPIRKLLQSAKTICEGAAGNIVASGAIALLAPLIGV